jgi:hypothetical protein
MRTFFTAFTFALILVSQVGSTYAEPLFIQDFKLHDLDAAILKSLGFESASVSYFSELASVTDAQLRERQQYEAVGCYPFYVMRNGKAEETGYNCRSFFCVGYVKGPKQCMDIKGKAYSGVLEISRRMGMVTTEDVRRNFSDYPDAEQTSYMKNKIQELSLSQCRPFYLLDFDVAVGEGYECDEIGRYPRYSGKFSCVEDWRKKVGRECNITVRLNELQIRADLLGNTLPASSSSQSSSSLARSSVSRSSVSSTSTGAQLVSFPDVIQGKYGYTAIMALAEAGIIKGYPDGTFRPKDSVNRAEFVQLLVHGLFSSELLSESGCFPDVGLQWFSEAICAAKRRSWVSGYPDGKFKPARTMKKSEAMKVVVASLDVPLDSTAALPEGTPDNQWYSPYIRKAMEIGLILEPTFAPQAEVTRADVAVWIYRARKFQMK